MSHFKTLSTDTIHQNPWWEYKHDRYLLPDGQERDYFYGEARGCAIIVPVLNDGRLVLVSQHRYLAGRDSVEFPRGGIMEKEMPADTAKRELKEETGMEAREVMNIGTYDSFNALFKDTAHLFVAWELTQTGAPSSDPGETIEIIYRRLDEFDDMIKRGEIWDGQTLAAWALAHDYLYKTLNKEQKKI